ncbi:N-acetylglucosaminyldiphosphoundecaprenol N-acetyl-beta-D-mannosaminyltransferase [Arthrobacter sp. SLBN-83]|uniref:WecB/TagA/CpsF family glycosyltransferase n=1 Tax=Arthrobacter sp. SLBN-83 TaxID=2768449 RepID=UPI00114DC326|nr:WecB/TagA/CpsF family glycosyltransferase [Arthrobacter sp. SLBN-83]TQJ59912.1 N-acetylglucosaminyldiphosphoundecaprenol N-acetyl-beta-D-mannosaminyltransferase [Arthrobacter sp. SLBN-83]
MPVLQQSELAVTSAAGESLLVGSFPVFTGDDSELLDALDELVSANQRSLVVTVNVDQLVDLGRSEGLFAAYEAASLRTLDGMPLVWMAKWAGAPTVHRQTGADLLTKCVSASRERGWKIVILGGGDKANDLAVRNLVRQHQEADLLGMKLPYSNGLDGLEEELSLLSDFSPDIVFVCLGSPKQEKLFMEYQALLPPAVYIGAGAAVDFASGLKVRAPVTLQKMGLEWVWRLLQEPRRLAYRYLVKGSAIGRIGYNTIRKRNR